MTRGLCEAIFVARISRGYTEMYSTRGALYVSSGKICERNEQYSDWPIELSSISCRYNVGADDHGYVQAVNAARAVKVRNSSVCIICRRIKVEQRVVVITKSTFPCTDLHEISSAKCAVSASRDSIFCLMDDLKLFQWIADVFSSAQVTKNLRSCD